MATVVPARNAGTTLGQCLGALRAAGMDAQRIVVVDDASEDATAQVAREAGVTVIATQGPVGAGAARNLGAAATDADLLLFVDADVAVHPDAIARMRATFTEPEIVAVFGSYDDAPPDVSVVSRYRNLLHHHVHQTAPAEARTFWTGLGAVRRHAFARLAASIRHSTFWKMWTLACACTRWAGGFRLDSAIQGKHLKMDLRIDAAHRSLGTRAAVDAVDAKRAHVAH
jgi:glycosyltransferase involved in cell wall biosynthesis